MPTFTGHRIIPIWQVLAILGLLFSPNLCLASTSRSTADQENSHSEIWEGIQSIGWANEIGLDSIIQYVTHLNEAEPSSYTEGELYYLNATRARWQRDFEQTFSLASRAYISFREAQSMEGQARALCYISNSLYHLNHVPEALFYSQRALNAARGSGISFHIGQCLLERGRVALALEDADSATIFLEEAESILRGNQSPISMGYTFTHLGEAWWRKGELTKSLYYFTEGRRLGEAMENPLTLCHALIGLGRVYLEQMNVEKAINSLAGALDIAKAQAWHRFGRDAAQFLSEAYLQKEDVKNQERYALLAMEFADSLALASPNPDHFEDELKDIQELLEGLSNESKRRIQNIGWGIGCALLLVIILLGYRNLKLAQTNQQRQSKEEELQKRIEALEAEQRKTQLREAYVRQREVSLEALDGFRNQMYIVLTHEMRDPLAALLTLQHDMLRPDLTLKEVRAIGRDSQRAMQTLYQLLQSIVFWIRLQKNGLQPRFRTLDNLATLDNALRVMQPVAEGYRMKLTVATQKTCKFSGDSELIHQIIQLLIFNAIRFNQSQEPITCSTFPGESRVVFSVTIPLNKKEETLASIWNVQSVEDIPNTQGDGTAGLTLWLCLRLILLMKGSAWEEYDEDYGQTLKFAIPLSIEEENGSASAAATSPTSTTKAG
ncbi:MAG: hypothetical protein AAFQ98_01710 [Bacteroidota bacterium]